MNDRLYDLLPPVYRMRDAEQGEALRALLGVLERTYDGLEADVDQLYDDLFIETADEWVVPYIGDLLGVRHLRQTRTGSFSLRAYVANTIAYRRRKGTASVLELLSRDVTNWPAHAVEFFQLLVHTARLNHVRPYTKPETSVLPAKGDARSGTANMRLGDDLDRIGSAFGTIAHTVDVRKISTQAGWFNLNNLGVFLWTLRRYPLEFVEPRWSDAPGRRGYHFSPVGNPIPLFQAPDTELDIFGRTGERNVPAPIRCRAFYDDLADFRAEYEAVPIGARPLSTEFYGPGRSLVIYEDGDPVPPHRIVSMNLKDWDRPASGEIGVDVSLGRMTFAEDEEPDDLLVSFNYGFSADMGGGPYRRAETMRDPDDFDWHVQVGKNLSLTTIQQALAQWTDADKPSGIIEIMDNRVYGGAIDIELEPETTLVIQATEGRRPDVRLLSRLNITAPPEGATLEINGLLIEGSLHLEGPLRANLIHSTIVPGRMLSDNGDPENPDRDSITAGGETDRMEVWITHSIVAPIRLPAEMRGITIEDSIVVAPRVAEVVRPALAATDDGETGPPATIVRSTVFGPVMVQMIILASEVIFVDEVDVERLQTGCVRFSYVPEGSRVPRRFRCQPDLALKKRADELRLTGPSALPSHDVRKITRRIRPLFTSVRYGEPAFGQLHIACVREITRGAEDGVEMGAFAHLQRAIREDNLMTCLDEYMRFGMDSGLIFET